MSGVFDAYSAYYDLLYRDKDYASEAAYVADLLLPQSAPALRILELGCGTGAHAEHLARRGFQVLGVDLSHSMLARAEERRAGLPPDIAARLAFMHGDARTFRADQTFDAVLSLFHVFSYQTSNVALDEAFSTAAAHLAPGGTLLFDYWYGPAVLAQRPSVRVRRMEDARARVLRIAEPEMDTNANQVRVNYSVMVEDRATNAAHAFTESHPMRYLFLPEIERMTSPAFKQARHYAWMRHSVPSDQDWAAVTVLERA